MLETWNISVLINDTAAEIAPFPSAVKNDDVNILKPASKKHSVIADKYLCERACKHRRQCDKRNSRYRRKAKALFEHIVQLITVLRSVVEAYHGCASDRIADKYRYENELHIHHYAKGRNAVFTYIFHQLEVVDYTYDR